MKTAEAKKTTLSLLPVVTAGHTMALANIVSDYSEKDRNGDFVLTPSQASALLPVLIIRGINQPMLAKTLAAHLNDKKGKGIFGLLALANDTRKAFKSLSDKSTYAAAKNAESEAASIEISREDWNA